MRTWLVLLTGMMAIWSKVAKAYDHQYLPSSNCLSWRLGVETNNIRAWRTIPVACLAHVRAYMQHGGQYEADLSLVADAIFSYANTITLSNDGLDAWILDVDDTCISNLPYYKTQGYGIQPYNPLEFKAWALRGACPAIPQVLRLFNNLIEKGFKVFLVTGRDEETFGQATTRNLQKQGYSKYQGLILRSAAYKGQSAITFKSAIRKQLVGQGYRIWGNIGDQWSDLLGDYAGNRTFKIPNPMYFVP